MDRLLPFRSHYAEVGGHRMHYWDEGDGPPVVMVHGNPTWAVYYRNLALRLRDQYRCIVPDHIGMGLSDKPLDKDYDYHFQQRVDDLENLLTQLDVGDDVTLVLHDWGGMIGMDWAARHPERVARLVLMNTAAFHLPDTKGFPWPLWLVRNTPAGALLVRGFNAFSAVAARVCCRLHPMSEEARRLYCAPYDSWRNRIATLRFVQDIPLRPSDRGYDRVTEVAQSLQRFRLIPSLLVWGMRDFVFDHHFLDTWVERLPEAEVTRFSECGHYVLEDAGAAAVDRIAEFLASHGPREGSTAYD